MDNKFVLIDDNFQDLSAIKCHLESIVDALKHEDNRISLSACDDHQAIVGRLMANIDGRLITSQDICQPLLDRCLCETIIQLFRLLRNSLVNCRQNKRWIVTNGSVLVNSIRVFKRTVDCYQCLPKIESNNDDLYSYKQSLIQIIKCCLQFFANLLSGLDETDDDIKSLIRHQMWSLFAFELFRYLLDFEDNSVVLISSMIFYSCLRNNSVIESNLFDTNNSEDLSSLLLIFGLLLKQIELSSSEWCLWSIQLFLKYDNFCRYFYSRFEMKQKLIILDIIHELLTNGNEVKPKDDQLSDANVQYLCQLFKQSIGDVYAVDSQTDDNKVTEDNKYTAIHVSKLLSILCEMTTKELYLCGLQTDRQLIECLVDTLKTIQLLSKSDKHFSSHFKSIPQLKQINETDSESQNPVFGFKRDLIRAVGNLVYKCQQMQDWVRELDGIVVILDCCNIDANNPYIMQWSIFAIKNILDNNTSNQQFVSQLSRNGVLIDDQLSQKLGLQNINH